MEELLRRSGVVLEKKQLDQLWRFHALLRKRNHDRDLTRLIDFESVVIKHYVDCMVVGELFPLPSPLLDIGTGAGFPGIPIKIRYPHLHMILAEQRPRRVEFLKEACAELGFQNVEVFGRRIISKSFAQPVAGVVTRAVETMDKTLLRTSACTRAGSLYVFLKGPSVDPELTAAMRRFEGSFRLVLDRPYVLPHTPHRRRLVVLEKLRELEGAGGDEEEETSTDGEEGSGE